MKRGSISSELLMCGGGMRSILLLPLVVVGVCPIQPSSSLIQVLLV